MSPEQARGRPDDGRDGRLQRRRRALRDARRQAAVRRRLGGRARRCATSQDPPPPLPREVPAGLRRSSSARSPRIPAERYPDGGSMADALRRRRRAARGGGRGRGADGRAAAGDVQRAEARAECGVTPRVRRRAPRPSRSERDHRPRNIAGSRSLSGAYASAPGRTRPPPPRARRPLRGARAPPPVRSARRPAGCLRSPRSLPCCSSAGRRARRSRTCSSFPRGGVVARARRLHLRPIFSRRSPSVAAGSRSRRTRRRDAASRAARRVRVVLSAGPPPVAVPDVVGSPPRRPRV